MKGIRLVVFKSSAEAMTQAEQCLATAFATRVGAIIAVFFDGLGRGPEAFPAIQGVESSWRELGGVRDAPGLRYELLPKIDTLRTKVHEAVVPYGVAVTHAVAAAKVLVTEWRARQPQYLRVAHDSLAVALEFDRFRIDPPSGHGSWVGFELAGEAALAEHVFRVDRALDKSELFDVRIAAGSGAMAYSEALKRWIG